MAAMVRGRCEHRHVIETLGASVMWSALKSGEAARRVPTATLVARSPRSTSARLSRRPVDLMGLEPRPILPSGDTPRPDYGDSSGSRRFERSLAKGPWA